MKYSVALSLAAVAGAYVLPEQSLLEDLTSTAEKTIGFISSEISNAAHAVKDSIAAELEHLFDLERAGSDDDASSDASPEEYDLSNHTIYELISMGNHTINFTQVVDEHEGIVKLLNSTDANYTLFLPTNEAFEDIPEDHKKPSKEFVEQALKYHIGLGNYPAGRILTTRTLPTALDESFLGGHHQRLRISIGLSGLRVNLYSKVIGVNIRAKNGFIHVVNKILVPPTMIGRELSFFPSQFSTLLLAYEKTNFVDFIHNVKMYGSTVFAPSNKAWVRLGPKVNAFLFNTEEGKKYLRALLKYQIVANTTVYSDKVYRGNEDKEGETHTLGHFHIELPTLLEGKSVGLDIHSWKGWAAMVVNGHIKVGFQDGVAKNGVVQVVEEVPIPPCKDPNHGSEDVTVDSLKERLRDFVNDAERGAEDWIGDL